MPRFQPMLRMLLAGATALAPTVAQAAAEGGKERSLVPSPTDPALWQEMLWSVVVFSIFFAVLAFVVWPKILKALQAREDKQRGDLEAAEKANADAKATLAEYERKLADAHAEARQILEQTRTDADQLRAKLKADTEAEMTKLRDQASADINRAKQAALQDLYAHSAELATAVAAKILQRQVTEPDTQRLIDQSLEELNQRKAS